MFEGRNADYIAPLAAVEAAFAMAYVSNDGTVYSVGGNPRFSVQSITKVFALTLALQQCGDSVWDIVSGNASGKAFNDSSLLDSETVPRNACINAGALSVTALLSRHVSLHDFCTFLSALGEEPALVDTVVAAGEYADCANNRTLCTKLRNNGVLLDNSDIEEILWYYCQQCALSMSCEQVAKCLLPLSNQGRHGGTQVLGTAQVAAVNATLLTAGTYDNAGIVLRSIGVPTKSGVGGGLAAIYPGRGVCCAWSPRLDSFGNSVAAQAALAQFTRLMGWSILV